MCVCRWKDDVERHTPKEIEVEKTSKWQWLKEKCLHFLGRSKQKYLRCWGHSKLNHPLRIMVLKKNIVSGTLGHNYYVCTQVKSQRTELLKHPLVYNLIEHKWDKFGRLIFYIMLFSHIALVTFLTAFALELLNPFSPTCMYV